MNFKNKVLALTTRKHQDKCGTIIDLVLSSKILKIHTKFINRDSSNQHMFNRKVIPGEKTFAETISSSMISSNPTFHESILPTSNVGIFGDSLVNFNRKTKYNINRSLNNGRARFKYFPGAMYVCMYVCISPS